jgi:flavodoxin
MKNGIVIYSKTGNTRSVAERLAQGMHSEIFEIRAVSDDPNILIPELIVKPDVSAFEHLVFASPVHGFSVSKIMEAYLKQLKDLDGKTVDLFITHHFPFAWMGGNRALKQMKLIIEAKKGIVGKLTSVNWTSKKREQVIEELIKTYSV